MPSPLYTASKSLGQNGGATNAFSSTGAGLIVLHLAYFSGTPVVTDNAGNTYQALTARDAGDPISRLFYCLNPLVRTGHVITVTGTNLFAGSNLLVVDGESGQWAFSEENGGVSNGVSGNGTGVLGGSKVLPNENTLLVTGQSLNAVSASEAFHVSLTGRTTNPFAVGVSLAAYLGRRFGPATVTPQFTGASLQRANTVGVFAYTPPSDDEAPTTAFKPAFYPAFQPALISPFAQR